MFVQDDSMTRVLILQPVITHYGISLFKALAARPGLELRVLASPRVPGAPATVDNLPNWAVATYRCRVLFGERLFWQEGLDIPPTWGHGDVVCINGEPRFLSILPILWKARRRNLGIIWWGHGRSATSVEWRVRIRSKMMNISDVILLYTEREAAEFAVRLDRRKPIIGLNNTLDPRPIEEAMSRWPEVRLAEFRRNQGIDDRSPLLLFCGRLRSSPSTQLEVALDAVARLAPERRDLRIAIIGDGEARTGLAELADKLGIPDRVVWVGQVYDEQLLAPWFLCATAFVYPGTIGLSLLHAMSYGLPVITHNDVSKHGPEIAALQDGVNGYTFPRGDPARLAMIIARLITQPSLRTALSRAAMATVKGAFSFEKMVQRFARAIDLASAASAARAGR
jgi:glycosyltransferase involved in cell wall biosynthesis